MKRSVYFALMVSMLLHVLLGIAVWRGHETFEHHAGERHEPVHVRWVRMASPPSRLETHRVAKGGAKERPHASQGQPRTPEHVALPQAEEAKAEQEVPMPSPREARPRQGAWLDQITEGVLSADRDGLARPRQRGALSLGSAASGPPYPVEGTRAGSTVLPDGGRRERVESSHGVYCVEVPNAATSLRAGSGPRLATVTNCP